MAITKLGLYNQALLAMKQRKLSALTDSNVARRTLDDFYDDTVAFLLAEGDWNFAGRTVAIEPSVDVEPEFGFTYAFDKPDDFVRLVSISANSDCWPTLDRYHDEGQYWWAFVSLLYIRYVSDGNDYGLDLSLWPQHFARAVALELAARSAPHIASMDGGALDKLEKDARKALMNARSKDARAQMAERPPPGRLTRARMGDYGFGRRNRSLWDDA